MLTNTVNVCNQYIPGQNDICIHTDKDESKTMNIPTQTQEQIHQAAKLYTTGRVALANFFPECGPTQLDMIASVLGAEAEAAKPIPSNAQRTGLQKKPVSKVVTAPTPAKTASTPKFTVVQSIAAALKAGGSPMSADDIRVALAKGNLLPKGSNPLQSIRNTLSVQKEFFTRTERGRYTLAPNVPFEVPKLGAAVAVSAPKPATKPKKVETNAFERVVGVLKKTTKPFTIPDMAKAAQLGEGYRAATTTLMTLEKQGVVSRLEKKSAGNKTLWKVDRRHLAKYLNQRQS